MTFKVITAVIAAVYLIYLSLKLALSSPKGAAASQAATGVTYPTQRRVECECSQCMEPTLRDTGYNDPPGLR